MLRFTQGGRFHSGLEQRKRSASRKRWQLLPGISSLRATSWCPRKRQLGISGVKSLCDESTARDLTTQILAWPQEGNLPVLSVA